MGNTTSRVVANPPCLSVDQPDYTLCITLFPNRKRLFTTLPPSLTLSHKTQCSKVPRHGKVASVTLLLSRQQLSFTSFAVLLPHHCATLSPSLQVQKIVSTYCAWRITVMCIHFNKLHHNIATMQHQNQKLLMFMCRSVPAQHFLSVGIILSRSNATM